MFTDLFNDNFSYLIIFFTKFCKNIHTPNCFCFCVCTYHTPSRVYRIIQYIGAVAISHCTKGLYSAG
jgi:hypothetical protein